MKDIYNRWEAIDPATSTANRRRIGMFLGVALGLTYGLVSQLGNRMILAGIPLLQPPAGPVGNVLLSGILGGALGLLTTWPASTTKGIVLGSLAAALGLVARGILQVGAMLGAPGAVLVAVIFGVPVTWLSVPVVALLRWSVGQQMEAQLDGTPLLARLGLPAIAMLVMAVLASFEILNPTARTELRRMDEMLTAAQAAASVAELPAPLAAPGVVGYPLGPLTAYTLEWTNRDLDRFIDLRPAANYDQHAAVVAHFADGYTLVCLYPTVNTSPHCATY